MEAIGIIADHETRGLKSDQCCYKERGLFLSVSLTHTVPTYMVYTHTHTHMEVKDAQELVLSFYHIDLGVSKSLYPLSAPTFLILILKANHDTTLPTSLQI